MIVNECRDIDSRNNLSYTLWMEEKKEENQWKDGKTSSRNMTLSFRGD
jgi:hypothetical protein